MALKNQLQEAKASSLVSQRCSREVVNSYLVWLSKSWLTVVLQGWTSVYTTLQISRMHECRTRDVQLPEGPLSAHQTAPHKPTLPVIQYKRKDGPWSTMWPSLKVLKRSLKSWIHHSTRQCKKELLNTTKHHALFFYKILFVKRKEEIANWKPT